ncbi:hypothetical protein FXO38_08526, partial [Capsicum annuum]
MTVFFKKVNLKTLHMVYKTAKEYLAAFLCKGIDALTIVHPHLLVGIPVVVREPIMKDGKDGHLNGVIEITMHNLIGIQVQ